MSLLRSALVVAMAAHEGQTTRDGQPYILHPVHVMLNVRDIDAKVVALLHDVLEDSDVSIDDLYRAGCTERHVTAVLLLTKPSWARSEEGYLRYINHIKANELARVVKIADLRHNLDVTRLPEFTDKDAQRVRKYLKALRLLESEEAVVRDLDDMTVEERREIILQACEDDLDDDDEDEDEDEEA